MASIDSSDSSDVYEFSAASISLARRVSRRLSRIVPTKPFVMQNSKPIVSFTFDDAPESALSVGASVLESNCSRGTFYISGALCGRSYSHAQYAKYLSESDCVTLHERGHEIGCHTLTHRDVVRCGRLGLAEELVANRRFFERLSPAIRLENFAYTFGNLTFARKLQLERNFVSCRSTLAGINSRWLDLGLVRAVTIYGHGVTRRDLCRWIDEAVAKNGWLVFVTHDVAEDHSLWGCSPDQIDFAASYAKARGCAILRVRDALRCIGYRSATESA